LTLDAPVLAGLFLLWLSGGSSGPQEASAPSAEPHAPVVRKLAGELGFSEGPVWLAREQKLVFSDIPRSALLEWSEAQGLRPFRAAHQPNGNALDGEGRLLTCQHETRDLVRAERDGSLRVLAARHEGRRLNSPNDLALRSDGSIWFTDPPWGLERQTVGKELPGHWVFRLDPESGGLEAVIRDLTMPNGITFSPDEARLYVSDTGGHPSHPDPSHRDRPARILCYAIDSEGRLVPEPRWQIPARSDGMCVDPRGRLYTTAADGVAIFEPGGELCARIPLPEAPTNLCFGGEGLRTLFVTARSSLFAIEFEPVGAGAEAASGESGG
jgi:gluconolactonase